MSKRKNKHSDAVDEGKNESTVSTKPEAASDDSVKSLSSDDLIRLILKHRKKQVKNAGGAHKAYRAQGWNVQDGSTSLLENSDSLNKLGQKYGILAWTIDDVEKEWDNPQGLWFEEADGEIQTVSVNGKLAAEPWFKRDEDKTRERLEQRRLYGFDPRELWNLDCSIAIMLYVRLSEYFENAPFVEEAYGDYKTALRELEGYIFIASIGDYSDWIDDEARSISSKNILFKNKVAITSMDVSIAARDGYELALKWLSEHVGSLWT